MYDLAVYIGRMSPVHKGHMANIQLACTLAPKVLILIGSCHTAATPKNPWRAGTRETMIRDAIREDSFINHFYPKCQFSIEGIPDHPSDTIWTGYVQQAVQNVRGITKDSKIALVGYQKDESSYYLTKFPEWKYHSSRGRHVLYAEETWEGSGVAEGYGESVEGISATQIRALMFENDLASAEKFLYPTTYDTIKEWVKNRVFTAMRDEYLYLKEYPKMRRETYPINDVTADSVVICDGHILLITRKNVPGRNLMALPGGFVNINETIRDAAIRELLEETKLHIPERVLRGSIVDEKVFDSPNRSPRGRIITTAFTIEVAPNRDGSLPRVYGSDDADKAFWVPISEIADPPRALRFFEDHWQIITTMINRL